MQSSIELSPGFELVKIDGINFIEEDDEEITIEFSDGRQVNVWRCRFNPDKFDLHIPKPDEGETTGGHIDVHLDAEVVVARISEMAATAGKSC